MEFVCHVKDEYDYRFICEWRDELFEHIKACYFHLMNANLPIFGVPGKLKDHCTSKKDAKVGIEKLPPDGYHLRSEDVYEPLVDQKQALDSTPGSFDDELPVMGANHRATFAKRGDMDVSLADFQIKKVIGRGSFGKVFLV